MSFRNTHKQIKIVSTQGKSWKENLVGILGNNSLGGLLSSLEVDKDVELTLDSDTFPEGLQFTNKIERPISAFLTGNSGKYGKIVGAVGSLVSATANVIGTVANLGQKDTPADVFNPWFKNTPAYDASALEPPKFSYTFNFAMGQYGLWNAAKEVAIPILNLIAPTLPREINSAYTTPPFPTSLGLFTSLLNNVLLNNGWESVVSAAGNFENISLDNVKAAWGNLTNGEGGVVENVMRLASKGAQVGQDVLIALSSVISTLLQKSYENYTYSISFGDFITFNNMVATASTCSFSSETDQHGIPIAGTCKLTFEGIAPAAWITTGVSPTIQLGGRQYANI